MSPTTPTPDPSAPRSAAGSSPSGVPLVGVARLDAMSTVLARNWWLVALRGVLSILFGVIAFVAPGALVLSLVLFFAAYMLVDGVFGIVAAVRAAQRDERWGYLLLGGLLNILVGVAAFLVPAAAVWAFIYLVAFWALVSGGLMVAAAFRLHRHYGRGWLVIGGLCSLLFGVLLLLSPGLSALVLTGWLGAYAVVFGAALVILAFQLRGRHEGAGRPLPGSRDAAGAVGPRP